MPGPTPTDSSFSDNLAQAQKAMSESEEGQEEKSEEKDPMEEYIKDLMKLVENLSGGSDTASDPMSMLEDNGADKDLNEYDADASKSNAPDTDATMDLGDSAGLEDAAGGLGMG